jgi:nucleoside-diphosphate-sugar epimerase
VRILITGANGYVGSCLLDYLKSNHTVIAATRQQVDLLDTKQVKNFFESQAKFDVLLHCAVVGGHRLIKDDWSVMDKNLIMYYNLMDNSDRFNRFINIGSGAEIFDTTNPYGFSKQVIYRSVLNNPKAYNIRVFSVFDHRELSTRFIKANIIRYINREPIIIHQDRSMDFFYMEDLENLVEYYISTKNPIKEIDCSYENSFTSLRTLANTINSLEDYKVEINVHNPVHGYPYVGSYKKIEGFEHKGLEYGIRETYNRLK